MPVGRPKHTLQQKEEAKAKRKEKQPCPDCNKPVARSSLWNHRTHHCQKAASSDHAASAGSSHVPDNSQEKRGRVGKTARVSKRARTESVEREDNLDDPAPFDDAAMEQHIRESSSAAAEHTPLQEASTAPVGSGDIHNAPGSMHSAVTTFSGCNANNHMSDADTSSVSPVHPARAPPSLDEGDPGCLNSFTPAGLFNEEDEGPVDSGQLDDGLLEQDHEECDELPEPDRPNDLDGQPPADEAQEPTVVHIEELQFTQKFIDALREATLDTVSLPDGLLERLRNPPTYELSITDPVLRFSLEIYLHDMSENTYNGIRESLQRVHGLAMLSYDQIKAKVRDISGVHPVYHDMCPGGCQGYTGPFAHLTLCPKCGEHRYDQKVLKTSGKKVPRQQFVTNLLGPQIQAAYRSRQSAEDMSYRTRCTDKMFEELKAAGARIDEWSDYIHGREYREAVKSGDLDENSTVLMLSLDGAQLYRNKASDCWMYIWVLMDRAPDSRYKKEHVLIGGVIPGPHKPGNMDSYLFPGYEHLAALMEDGLKVWDASRNLVFTTRPFLFFLTADGPGMTELNGLVGHSGAHGCRLYCKMKGRHKPDVGHYYPACLKPRNYDVHGCSHDDVRLSDVCSREAQKTAVDRYTANLKQLISSRNQTQYKQNRLVTGIAKPSLASGLSPTCMVSLPACCPGDIMHLSGINIPDLLINMWRGLLTCDTRMGDSKDTWDWAVLKSTAVWNAHGKQVADATPYLPGSFDRPPRNPAEKISSGYKAVEFQTYLYGLGPALFYGLLPMKYWKNFCKLVRGLRLLHQRRIISKEIAEAHRLLLEFCQEWEELYYQRNPARLHFVRQSIHALCHIAPETTRIGPYAGVAQWTMERAIGDLGAEIRQHSKAGANLAQRSSRRCAVNAIKAMIPELSGFVGLPRGAVPLRNGFVLLRKCDTASRSVTKAEGKVLVAFARTLGVDIDDEWAADPSVVRWARLRLPNGQIARSLWREEGKALGQIRMARNVKIHHDDGGFEGVGIAEVLYYFLLNLADGPRAFAMCDFYGPPDEHLWRESCSTLWSCARFENSLGLAVIEVQNFQSVVAVVPHPVIHDESLGDFSKRYFVVEKLGLDVVSLVGFAAENGNGDNE